MAELWRFDFQNRTTPLLDYSSLLTFNSQRRLNLSQRQAIQHVRLRQPAFAGDADSEPQILQTRCAMGIRIDYTFNAFLFG